MRGFIAARRALCLSRMTHALALYEVVILIVGVRLAMRRRPRRLVRRPRSLARRAMRLAGPGIRTMRPGFMFGLGFGVGLTLAVLHVVGDAATLAGGLIGAIRARTAPRRGHGLLILIARMPVGLPARYSARRRLLRSTAHTPRPRHGPYRHPARRPPGKPHDRIKLIIIVVNIFTPLFNYALIAAIITCRNGRLPATPLILGQFSSRPSIKYYIE